MSSPATLDGDAESLVAAYSQHLTGYDEMVGPDGLVRSHWQPVVRFLEREGPERSAMMSERVQRRIVENGLTLDSFSDPLNAEQPWKLDLIPFVISPSEWAFLEAALIQRMRLMEALLGDLYGPQETLTNETLPHALVFNDPSFLQPLHGTASDPARLMFLGVDLARDDTGAWRILDCHAETIAGHGYALANRVAMADVCARMFRDSRARRISRYYQELAQELLRRAGNDDATVAILGPNPDHETYLSHAYMARYLGYLLLEGSDLRVDGDRVFQKTLAGLQPIDLLVRAVQASKADPLELDPDGFEGPAGLVQAVRHNPSLVANALGTAIVENRGLAPYLSALAKQLLGEELSLREPDRVWLGDPHARERVLTAPEAFFVRPAFEGPARPGHAAPGQPLSTLDDEARQSMTAELNLNGARYVAERPTAFATAPSFTSEGLVPRPCALRLFVSARDGGYAVMPGGLALTIDAGAAVALTSAAAESRDIWVTTDAPQGPHYSRWRISEEEAQVQRLGTRLPSRVADNLYWLGRYVERADWTLRVMRNALSRGDEDLRAARQTEAAENAIDIIASKGMAQPEDETTATPPPTLEDRVEQLFSAAGNPYGIRVTFQNIRRVARQSRDRLSLDAWRLLSGLTINRGPQAASAADPAIELVERLDQRIAELAAFNGLMHENMTRNFGWRFIDMGRRTERALQMAELLRKLLADAVSDEDETEHLAFLLETADSFMTYRARYRFAPTFPLVVDLLLIDETNPRGIAFQLVQISDHLAQLPKSTQDAVRTPEQRIALDMMTQVRLADIDQLRRASVTGQRSDLVALLDRLIEGLPQLSDIISRRYFSLTEEQPQRVHTRLAP